MIVVVGIETEIAKSRMFQDVSNCVLISSSHQLKWSVSHIILHMSHDGDVTPCRASLCGA